MEKAPIEFMVSDHKGRKYRFTAENLLDRVLEDAKWLPFYGWNVPMSELARVTTDPEFPTDCAEQIQFLVISHFNLTYTHELPRKPEIELAELDSIWRCFYSLQEKKGAKNREECEKFISCLITCQVRIAEETLEHPHPGTDFKLFVRSYIREKNSKWQGKQGNELKKWIDSIPDDFRARVNQAEQKGQFTKSDIDAWSSISSARPHLKLVLDDEK